MARVGIRAKAETVLGPIVKRVPIYSNQLQNGEDQFARYTGGLTQDNLEKNWNTVDPKTKKKGMKTGCNAFVGWYSSQIGKLYLGGFYIEEDLRKAGKVHAWVRAAAGGQPRYGDICLHANGLHVSVSLDMVGGTWERVNAGQGGPKRGCDVIDVSRGTWASTALKGWVDIDALSPQEAPVPDWLQGWWAVEFRGDPYYYYFDVTHQVKWSEYRPRDTMTRMMAIDGGVGTFSVTSGGEVTVRWRSGTVEKFTKSSGDSLRGTSNDREPISAERM
jgi:hypothetical protein